MTTKHTPGPWHSFYHSPSGHFAINSAKDCIATAYVPLGIDQTAGPANAHLIAAAPELLELARGTLSYCQDDSRSPRRRAAMIAAASDLIAKAEGRS